MFGKYFPNINLALNVLYSMNSKRETGHMMYAFSFFNIPPKI